MMKTPKKFNPWAHDGPVSPFSSWLESKQLYSEDNSTQNTLQAMERAALSLWTHLTVPATERGQSLRVQHCSHWDTRKAAGSQRNSALLCCPWSWVNQRGDPPEMLISQMLRYQALEFAHFRHWDMLLREVRDSSLGTCKRCGCGTWGYGSVENAGVLS